MDLRIGVLTKPGQMAFSLTPLFIRLAAIAAERVNPIMPCFEAQ